MELSVADQLELHDLYARYTHTIDSYDKPGWLGTWAKDAKFDLGFFVCEGPVALEGFFDSIEQAAAERPYRHYTSNVSVRPEGDGAAGRAYLMVLNLRTGGFDSTGYYDDTLVRTPDGWRFAVRQLHVDTPPTTAK